MKNIYYQIFKILTFQDTYITSWQTHEWLKEKYYQCSYGKFQIVLENYRIIKK